MHDVVPFSEMLRARARRSSDDVASGAFRDDLAAGRCDVADYAEMIAQYAFLYDALERAAARVAADPVLRPFVTGQRSRLPAITADLEFLVGPDWSELMSPLPTTIRSVRRVCAVAADWPAGFVAHHYARYLGEVRDAPTIGQHLAEQFGFDTNGIGFILLDEVAEPADFARTYREQLDAAPWDADERSRVVTEVAHAQELDRAMLAELDDRRRGWSVTA